LPKIEKYSIIFGIVIYNIFNMFQKPIPEVNIHNKEHSPNEPDDIETVVGPSVHVEGDFSSEGNILVKGIVSGNVKTSKLFTSERGSKVLASVKAGSAVISGAIKGNVKVDDRLEVTASAQITGDIDCKVLVVEAGAALKGKVTMKVQELEGSKNEKKSGLIRRAVKEEE